MTISPHYGIVHEGTVNHHKDHFRVRGAAGVIWLSYASFRCDGMLSPCAGLGLVTGVAVRTQ